MPDFAVGLRQCRKLSGLSQRAVAERAGVSVLAVQRCERGAGSLATLSAVLEALDLEVGGRSLPPGNTIGSRLAALRARRGLGLRRVAILASVSPATVAAIERGADGHLAAVLLVADALGARLVPVARGTEPEFWTHAAASSAHHGWTTPTDVLERLYRVVGGPFALDPCSPTKSGPRASVHARVRFTAADDALTRSWRAPTVFMNPPYGRGLKDWVAKARTEVEVGRAGVLIALVSARCDTGWWHRHVAGLADVWMLQGRLTFGTATTTAPFPSALMALGRGG